MKKALLLFTVAAAALSVSAQLPYKVIVPTTPESEGKIARLINYDTKAVVDSVVVKDQAARFEGKTDEGMIATISLEGMRFPVFILEPGTVSFGKNGAAFGTMLNDQMREFNVKSREIRTAFRSATTEEEKKALADRYDALSDSILNANSDNMLGYYFLMAGPLSGNLTMADVQNLQQKYPALTKGALAQKTFAGVVNKEATSPGHKFVDFTITEPDGKVQKLSDYVGKGKYTLVDFWASWCGPCIRETKVIKELYNKYADKGLEVLGVAVWDEPQNTMQAIKTHELPWKQIINAQSVPTDIYGISGIPCIILFDPEGKIISRDKQDADLVADVDAAMEAAAAPRVGAQEALE